MMEASVVEVESGGPFGPAFQKGQSKKSRNNEIRRLDNLGQDSLHEVFQASNLDHVIGSYACRAKR